MSYEPKPDCPGSYGQGINTRFGRRRVTGECPVCGKRVSYVTMYALKNNPRGLGLHSAKVDNKKVKS